MWDARFGELLWVDIDERLVHRHRFSDCRVTSLRLPEAVSVVLPRKAGGWIVGQGHKIAALEPDGRLQTLADLEPGVRSRTNDARCDRAGRLWIGTMDRRFRPGRSSLYRVDPDLSVHLILPSLTIPNGIAWDRDERQMFFVDSVERRADVFEFNAETGEIGMRRPIIDLRDCTGVPDGMTIDEEGTLWIAMCGGGEVRRYSQGGDLLGILAVPTQLVTSVCFGGPQLDVLYITTARDGRGHDELAGALFRAEPGITGTPIQAFRG